MKIRLGFGLLNYPFESGKEYFRWVEMLEKAGPSLILIDELLEYVVKKDRAEELRDIESKDPDCIKYPRFLKSEDASAILMKY